MFIKAVIDEDNLLRDTPVSACVCTTISHPTSRLQSPATKDNPITNEINFVNITGTINIINLTQSKTGFVLLATHQLDEGY